MDNTDPFAGHWPVGAKATNSEALDLICRLQGIADHERLGLGQNLLDQLAQMGHLTRDGDSYRRNEVKAVAPDDGFPKPLPVTILVPERNVTNIFRLADINGVEHDVELITGVIPAHHKTTY